MAFAAERDPRAKALAAGRAWGRKLDSTPQRAPDATSADEAIDHLVEVLDELGFAPERRASRRGATGRPATLPVSGTGREPDQRRVPGPPRAHARSHGNLGGAGLGRPARSVRRTGSVPGPPDAGGSGQVSTGPAIAVAVTFVWLGMVLAISFLEAPLKFRAPNVTLQIGLGIGRLVFRALNTVEVGFALVIVAIVAAGPTPARIAVAFSVAVRRTGHPVDRGASPIDPPFRPGARRDGCAALPGSLRLCRFGGGQGGCACSWRGYCY